MKFNKFLPTLFLLIICSTELIAQTEVDIKKFNEAKFTLIQRLLTCQSVAYTTINTSDFSARSQYVEFGNKNYNYAYKAFIEMQTANENMDENLRKQISSILELYSKAYSSIDGLDSEEMALALSFAKVRLEMIVKELYEKNDE